MMAGLEADTIAQFTAALTAVLRALFPGNYQLWCWIQTALQTTTR